MGCHLIVNCLSRSGKRVAGTLLGGWNGEHCVVPSGDITLSHALLKQRSTFSAAAVRVAACISDSASPIESVRYVESRKQSAKSPRIRPVRLPEGNSCFRAAC